MRNTPRASITHAANHWQISRTRMLEKTPTKETRESGHVGATMISKAGKKIGDVLPP